jgi:DNA-binding NtrC family response regulator
MEANPPETRVIASSRRDLSVLAATGQFRQDLYHHLAMVEITVPSLRDRRGDLAALATHFLTSAAAQCRRPVPMLSDDALQRLRQYGWPGNLRELENILRGAMLAANGAVIEVHHLPALEGSRVESLRNVPAKAARLQDVIDRHVVQVLEECEGNKVRAAELLGISRSTLYRMLETGLSSIS